MKIPRAVILALGCALAALSARAADAPRTLRAELSGADLASFQIENLVGRMRVSAGAADGVTVAATVHAEDPALAEAVRIERIVSAGIAILRVRYPYSKVSTFRYTADRSDMSWDWGFSSSSSFEYDGHSVKVSSHRGTPLYADLEVRVPSGALHAVFRNLVGRLDAEGLEGNLRFDVESADLQLRRLSGELSISGSSGDIRAADIRGSWSSDFSSGDCRIDDFEGTRFEFQSSSGDLVARGVRAGNVRTDTSSGDVALSAADVENFTASSSSGDILLVVDGSRLKGVDATTSSGDVTLRLPPRQSFDAVADQSSGDMYVGFSDGEKVYHGETLVGFRHGTGDVKVRVTTSSGDFSISPL